MKDEELIGQEFEAVEFKSLQLLKYDPSKFRPFLGKIGIVQKLHDDFPQYCLVRFNGSIGIGTRTDVYFPTAVVKQQIEDRVPIDLDNLFNQIKSL